MKRPMLSLTLKVALLLSGAAVVSAQNSLTLSSFTAFLNGSVGGSAVQQTFTISSSPVTSVAFTGTFSNASWLTVTPLTGNTPMVITLTANPAGLNPGVYGTTLTFSSPNAGTVSQQVVLTVNNPATPLVSTPGNLTFTYTPGAPLPQAQTLNIATGGIAPPFLLTPLSASWLLLGQSGTSITVAVNPAGLTPGLVYVGGIQIGPSNGQPAVIVPVALYYFPSPQVSVSPSALTFNYQIGAGNNTVQKAIAVT